MARIQKNTRYFMFEGKERTVSEIQREFFPTTANGTIYTRLINSGATTKDQYMQFLARGTKVGRPASTSERRFHRQVRAKSDSLVGEKGCNFCNKIRPVAQLKAIPGNRRICVHCDKDRTRTMSAKNQQVMEYQTVSKFIKAKDDLLKDMMRQLIKLKSDRSLWDGRTGFTPAHREDINDLQRRFVALNLEEQP